MPSFDLADTSIPQDEPLWQVNKDDYRFVVFALEVRVYKGSDSKHAYTITRDGGCDCPSAMYGSGLCKHERVISALGRESLSQPNDTDLSIDLLDN